MNRTVTAMVVVCGCAASVWAGPTFTRKAGPAQGRPQSAQPGVIDALPFSDNFDSYANNSNLGGQGTWQKWEPASVEAVVTNAQASSPANSFRIDPLSDVTQQGNITSGKWELKCKTYWPSNNVGSGANDGGFVIGLNQFNAASPNTQPISYWSAQIQWHAGTNSVRNYNLTTESTPIVADQWVDFRMVIDLTADKWDAYYNGIQIVTQKPWSTNLGAGTVRIACFDFFSGNALTTVPFAMFFDNVSFSQVSACYANCDGSTSNPLLTANDFTCFLNNYTSGNSYANCDGIGGLTANDFTCFLNAYTNGCT